MQHYQCSVRDLCLQLIQSVPFPSEAEVKFIEYGARLAPGLQGTPFWVLLASPAWSRARSPRVPSPRNERMNL